MEAIYRFLFLLDCLLNFFWKITHYEQTFYLDDTPRLLCLGAGAFRPALPGGGNATRLGVPGRGSFACLRGMELSLVASVPVVDVSGGQAEKKKKGGTIKSRSLPARFCWWCRSSSTSP